ncbi:hypothetical protein TSOC_006209 [Tetrabaena socialis]|uniref:Uncharacterized protein n=1 Tax=Tetrabaena socialis TaxID=47790 RepID=A0A2J8A462_9CHLO|nr:hypothetical protein TSOC_006209 [Tetrabaena socialis]|eukprot:PNH07311.1 hypothetical protein TSOC_006209 [Tetrabaena socialis]
MPTQHPKNAAGTTRGTSPCQASSKKEKKLETNTRGPRALQQLQEVLDAVLRGQRLARDQARQPAANHHHVIHLVQHARAAGLRGRRAAGGGGSS